MKRTKKPIWPHAAITPMSAHMGAGQWYRTYRGKPIYFGVLRDPDAALKKYTAWAKGLANSQPVKVIPGAEVTLNIGLNHFLTAREQDMEKGELSAGQFIRYRRAVTLISAAISKDTLVAELSPSHFEALRKSIPGGAVNVGNVIRDIRTAFHWIDRHYGIRPRYGDAFKKPRRTKTRRDLWTAADLRAVMAVAEPPLRAMLLLAINCGFGQTDCARLTKDSFNLEGHWFSRPKTGVERRCPFWPATTAAINNYRRWRPDLYPHLLFLSKYGKPLVRDDPIRNAAGEVVRTHRKDSIAQMLRRACAVAGVNPRPFYSIRHTFRSVADGVPDTTAINVIMGHSCGGMKDVYNQLMADGSRRLKAVTDHVHAWLWAK